jgi:hypothetical protein
MDYEKLAIEKQKDFYVVEVYESGQNRPHLTVWFPFNSKNQNEKLEEAREFGTKMEHNFKLPVHLEV